MRLPTVLLLALFTATFTALTAGCASGSRSSGETATAHHGIAREHAYTRLLEVRVGAEIAVAAYLVEFERLPLGVIDERPYPVGTALVQDVQLNTMGFLTPGGQGFRFDEDGASHDIGHGSRHELVARVLGTSSKDIRFRAVGASR